MAHGGAKKTEPCVVYFVMLHSALVLSTETTIAASDNSPEQHSLAFQLRLTAEFDNMFYTSSIIEGVCCSITVLHMFQMHSIL